RSPTRRGNGAGRPDRGSPTPRPDRWWGRGRPDQGPEVPARPRRRTGRSGFGDGSQRPSTLAPVEPGTGGSGAREGRTPEPRFGRSDHRLARLTTGRRGGVGSAPTHPTVRSEHHGSVEPDQARRVRRRV